jgi:hypothetical protein
MPHKVIIDSVRVKHWNGKMEGLGTPARMFSIRVAGRCDGESFVGVRFTDMPGREVLAIVEDLTLNGRIEGWGRKLPPAAPTVYGDDMPF